MPANRRATVVFIDAQNVYQTAREAFGWEEESSRRGNFRALALGQYLTMEDDRELKQVRVYTGIPAKIETSRDTGQLGSASIRGSTKGKGRSSLASATFTIRRAIARARRASTYYSRSTSCGSLVPASST